MNEFEAETALSVVASKRTYGPPCLQADFLDGAVETCANVSGVWATAPSPDRASRVAVLKRPWHRCAIFQIGYRTRFDCPAILIHHLQTSMAGAAVLCSTRRRPGRSQRSYATPPKRSVRASPPAANAHLRETALQHEHVEWRSAEGRPRRHCSIREWPAGPHARRPKPAS